MYYYSFGGENGRADAAHDQRFIRKKQLKVVKNIHITEKDGETLKEVEYDVNHCLTKINYIIA